MIRAAFIGVDRHQDPLIRDLNGAARDASALWAVLSDSIDGLAASLITDEAASLQAVIAALDDSLGAAGEDDVVLLSFAGHGTPDHRLVLADTRVDDLVGTTLDMAQLAERFRTSRARVVLLLLDCCFSGGAPARVLDLGLMPRDIGVPLAEVAGQGRVLFAASAPDEAALEDPQTRHGLFTKAILDCLLASEEPLSVIGLVDHVVRLVRADANRFGYDQTPAMFGHVEGELTLPAGRRGKNYFALFPERGSAKTTGDFDDIAAYGIPTEVLAAWRDRFQNGLNALQIAAVNEHGVLDGNSLLVVAPTSAGKTFVGEMAALKAITEGRKAIFLLPYKALVNEKYEDFSAIYGERLNLRIARCSGDWQDQVGDVLRGKYDIAFFTYEKFLSLSVTSPHIVNQIGLVVLDEAQFITEPGRGMVVELLLTSLVSARLRGISPQLLALSAVIGDINGFDHWLDCGLLMTTERPVPLTEGVLDRSGSWRFKGAGDEVHVEQMLDRWAIQQRGRNQSSQDMIVPLARYLVGKGEKVIVFRNARGSSGGCAEYLARELGLAPAQAVIDALPEGDLSAMSERLRTSLAGGVAFHNGDLNRDERVAVERGFRDPDGGVHVLVATSTVAAGVNTPASTVIIVETAFPGPGEGQPYTVAQFKNMAGRAGRLGYETEGKAILLADTNFEREALFRRYVQGRPEPITSSFDARRSWHVGGQASRTGEGSPARCRNRLGRQHLRRIFGDTARFDLAGRHDRAARRFTRPNGCGRAYRRAQRRITLDHAGRACGESPLTLESALQAVELLRRLDPATTTLEVLLVLVEALPERDQDYTPQVRQGEAGRQQEAAQRFGWDVVRMLRHRAPSDRDFYARCKRALIIADWLDGVATSDIEARYSSNAFVRVGHGDIRGYADGSRFLLDSVLRIAAIVLERAEQPEEAAALLKRLDLGIPASALELTTLPIILSRGELLDSGAQTSATRNRSP